MKERQNTAPGASRIGRLLWTAALIAGVLAAVPQNARAIPRIVRYVRVTATPENLDLGSVPTPGVFDSAVELTVHVAANCAHAGVVLSMPAPLTAPGGATIPLNRTWVKLPAGPFVALTAPVAVTGPMNPGVFDVVLKFRVETTIENLAGTYAGTITLTCSTGP